MQIEAKDRQMSAIIIYDTGSEFSFCNQGTKPLVTNTKKERRNLAISTINKLQNGLMQLCKLRLKNDHNIETIMLLRMKLQLKPQNIPSQWQKLEGE